MEGWGLQEQGRELMEPIPLSCETAPCPGLPGQAVGRSVRGSRPGLLAAPHVGECVHAPQPRPERSHLTHMLPQATAMQAKVRVTQVRIRAQVCQGLPPPPD